MKKFVIVVVLLLWGSFVLFADQAYDHAAAVKIMHSNAASVGAIKAGLSSGDYTAVALAFVDLAKNALDMKKMAPPKGSADEWQKIWDSFATSAFIGVGAAGEKDAAKAQAALGQISGDVKQGHHSFRG